jgi:hypothetical protein
MIPKSSLPKSKRPNIKPQRGLGQAVSRQRRKANDELKRQRNGRIERERQNAREMLNRQQRQTPEEMLAEAFGSNLMSAIVTNQSAVMHSHGINVPVYAQRYNDWMGNGRIKAYTDFQSIVMRMPQSIFPAVDSASDAVIDFVATVRGVFQHELGHIRFTVPFANLPWGSDVDNDERRQKHWAWNCLEDQRMETAVVKDAPIIASYFTKMVAIHIIDRPAEEAVNAWLLVAGRRYLPTDVRQRAHNAFAHKYGVDAPTEWRHIVAGYISATTHEELAEYVNRAYAFLAKHGIIMSNDESHARHEPQGTDPQTGASDDDPSDDEVQPDGDGEADGDESGDESGDEGEANGSGDPSDSEGDDESDGASGKGDGEATDDGTEGDSESDGGDPSDGERPSPSDSDADADGERPSNGATTGEVDTDKLREAIDKALEDATKEVRQDKANHNVVAEANELQNRGGLLPWRSHHDGAMPAEQQAKAEQLAIGMENALSDFVTASQPVWMSHQEHGVIDPISFRTKSVGDNAYRRGMDGDATAGLDLHVSLLCDASVSMNGDPMIALSQTMYATSLACDRLGIGTSFTLWSSSGDNYRVNADHPVIWPTLGGTDPTEALNDLESHNPEGASQHLVIVFTDGDWNHDFPGLHQWARPDRHIVLAVYREGWSHYIDSNRGADEAIAIGNILDMPSRMTGVIANLLTK